MVTICSTNQIGHTPIFLDCSVSDTDLSQLWSSRHNVSNLFISGYIKSLSSTLNTDTLYCFHYYVCLNNVYLTAQ